MSIDDLTNIVDNSTDADKAYFTSNLSAHLKNLIDVLKGGEVESVIWANQGYSHINDAINDLDADSGVIVLTGQIDLAGTGIVVPATKKIGIISYGGTIINSGSSCVLCTIRSDDFFINGTLYVNGNGALSQGFYVANTVTHFNISGVRLTGLAGEAVYVDGTQHGVITQSVLSGNNPSGKSGVYITSGAKFIRVIGNYIGGFGAYGVEEDEDDGTSDYNLVQMNVIYNNALRPGVLLIGSHSIQGGNLDA